MKNLIEKMKMIPEEMIRKNTEVSKRIKTKKIFGHNINLPQGGFQQLEQQKENQQIKDWIIARDNLLEMIQHEGLEPLFVVPSQVFYDVCEALEIVTFGKNLDFDTGRVNFPSFLVVDHILSPIAQKSFMHTDYFLERIEEIRFFRQNSHVLLFHEGLKRLPLYVPMYHHLGPKADKIYKEHFMWRQDLDIDLLSVNILDFFGDKYSQEDIEHDQLERYASLWMLWLEKKKKKDLKKKKLSYRGFDKSQHLLDFKHNYNSFLVHFHIEFASLIALLEAGALGMGEYSKYDIFSKIQKSFLDGQKMPTLEADVDFGLLPDDIQNLFLNIHRKFPGWPLYTAADPDFFELSLKGIDFWNYSKKSYNFWKKTIASLKKEIPSMKRRKREYDQRIKKDLEEQDLSFQTPSVFITSEEEYAMHLKKVKHDALRKKDPLKKVKHDALRKKDPFFYTPTIQRHKNIDHEMVIVWGQFGDSPREKEALEYLKKLSPKIFQGSKI